MGIRAHRVKTFEISSSPTFSFHHEKIVKFLEEHGVDLDPYIIEVPVEVMEKLLETCRKEKWDEAYLYEQIRKDIEATKEKGEDYIMYVAI